MKSLHSLPLLAPLLVAAGIWNPAAQAESTLTQLDLLNDAEASWVFGEGENPSSSRASEPRPPSSVNHPRRFRPAAGARPIAGHKVQRGGRRPFRPVHERLASNESSPDLATPRTAKKTAPQMSSGHTSEFNRTRPKTSPSPVQTRTKRRPAPATSAQPPVANELQPTPSVPSRPVHGGQAECAAHPSFCRHGQAEMVHAMVRGYGTGCGLPYLFPACRWDNLTFRAGVHGFKNPVSLGQDGSFGFHEGFNWAAPFALLPYSGLGVQAGVNATHSNFSDASFTDQQRNQVFFTGGFFRRVDVGLQAGVVFDHLSDDWYAELSLSQVRGEISWMHPSRHEFGFWFAASSSDDEADSPIDMGAVDVWTPTDVYALFYRRRFHSIAGEGRFSGGFTENGDGLIAAEAMVPLNHSWSLDTAAAYLVPNEPTQSGGTENESWNLSISLVWHFGRNARCHQGNYYRPLLSVADNGSFFLDRSRP